MDTKSCIYSREVVVNGKVIYRALEAHTSAETFDATKWEPISEHELPTASAEVLGGVKLGEGLKVDENGVVSVELVTDDEIDSLFE